METLHSASAVMERSAGAVAGDQRRVLAGPPPGAGTERLFEHRARLGPLPPARDRRAIIPVLEASALLGRGGAGFPVGRKWRSVAERRAGDALVVVNGAEGEPLSAKDRAVMTLRPHLLIDGALLAADAIGSGQIVMYVGVEHERARDAVGAALAEREPDEQRRIRLVAAPTGYVSGEASAVVHYLNDGVALPTWLARPWERGVNDQPTLVQNVESLAHTALIARFGDAWYRSAGRAETAGTALVTMAGAVARPGVREIEYGTPIAEAVALAGGATERIDAVLAGGYFGAWHEARAVGDLPLDPAAFSRAGGSFGCGIVWLKPEAECGVAATARIMAYMAGESAAQCGPCTFGLAALAAAVGRVATLQAAADDLGRIERWAGLLPDRGACRHPDGAAGMLASALRVFGDEFVRHARHGRCAAHEGQRRVA